MKSMAKWMAVVAVVLGGLVSCNTAIGFSRDLRTLGTGLENKAHGRTWKGDDTGNVPAPNPNAPAY